MFKTWVCRNELLSYFILTFILSWSIGIPLALSVSGTIRPLPLWLHYLTAYGPMLSALIVITITQGYKGLVDSLARIIKWNINLRWLLIAFSPIILFILSDFINFIIKKEFIDLSSLGQINFLPNLGIFALILWILNSGLGEEVGWRGFALPRLQKNMSALKASLLLSVPWIIWHLPAFFYLPNYIQIGFTIFPMFAMGVAAGAIIYTWLFNNTKGSVLIAILFHGAFNFVTASKAGGGLPAAIISTIIIVWAIGIVILYSPQNFSVLKHKKIISLTI